MKATPPHPLTLLGLATALAVLLVGCGEDPDPGPPDVAPCGEFTVSLSISRLDLSALEIERDVVAPIEADIADVQGVLGTRSLTRQGGAEVEVVFDGDEDLGGAIAAVRGVLRAQSEEGVEIGLCFGPEEIALAVAASADFAPEALDGLAREFQRASGVAQVGVFGRGQPQVVVQVDPERLVAFDLSPLDVLETLRLELATGTVASDEVGRAILAVREGAPIELRDVAEVRRDVDPPVRRAWLDGAECAALVVYPAPGADLSGMRESLVAGKPGLQVFSPRVEPAECLMASWLRPDGMHADLPSVLSTLAPSHGGRFLTLVGPGRLGLGQQAALFLAPASPRFEAFQQLTDLLAELPGLAEAHVATPGKSTRPPAIRLFCDDLDLLIRTAEEVRAGLMMEIDTVLSVALGVPGLDEEVRFAPDQERLSAVGVSAADLGVLLRMRMAGIAVGGESDSPVTLRIGEPLQSLDELADLAIRTADGGLVPLSSLGEFKASRGFAIPRLNGSRGIPLHVLLPVAGRWAAFEAKAKPIVDSIVPNSVRVEWP